MLNMNLVLESMNIDEYDIRLYASEGVGDFFKGIGEKIKGFFNWLKEKIKALIEKLGGLISKLKEKLGIKEKYRSMTGDVKFIKIHKELVRMTQEAVKINYKKIIQNTPEANSEITKLTKDVDKLSRINTTFEEFDKKKGKIHALSASKLDVSVLEENRHALENMLEAVNAIALHFKSGDLSNNEGLKSKFNESHVSTLSKYLKALITANSTVIDLVFKITLMGVEIGGFKRDGYVTKK